MTVWICTGEIVFTQEVKESQLKNLYTKNLHFKKFQGHAFNWEVSKWHTEVSLVALIIPLNIMNQS